MVAFGVQQIVHQFDVQQPAFQGDTVFCQFVHLGLYAECRLALAGVFQFLFELFRFPAPRSGFIG